MDIKSVEFVKSSAHPRECPDMDRPEYAFIGRSNVGKSSLINMLVGRTSMAKISSTPGKTQLINHFAINGQVAEKAQIYDKKKKNAGDSESTSGNSPWFLTDLPGFGYAKISKSERVKWERTSQQFLEGRKNLMCTMMLVDSRLKAQKKDLEFMAYLGEAGLPFVLVFTKVDKLNKTEREQFQSKYEDVMLKQWNKMPATFVTSAVKGDGKDELLSFIESTNVLY